MPAPNNSSTFGNLNPQGAIANLEAGASGSVMNSTTNFYKVGWFSDWKASGLIGVAIVCSIIALAAMIGKAFNLPEIKAFANNEIKQAVISVLFIVSLIALVSFFNEIAVQSIAAADLPVDCNVPEPCYVAAAKTYLTTIIDIGKSYSKDNLKESIDKMRRSSYGYNINANIIYLLYAGFSIRFNAGDSLVAERHGALFSQTSKILVSLSAQKYFIDVVTFGIAPLFILLGVVLRTFFFTRKLGGLLLAIAISLFIIYPLTYAFAWYTLNVTVYGERTLAVADPFCPGECTATYPSAFFSDPTTGELVQFPTTQSIVRAGIKSSNWDSGGPDLNGNGQPDFPGLVACKDLSTIGIPNSGGSINQCPDCPDYCRDVPFPANMPGCNITKCSSCNPGCKLVRQRLNCQTDPDCAGKCPEICRTRVPTENKCFSNESGGIIPANLSISCSGCEKYPAWCRFLREEPPGTYTRVYNDTALNAACTGVDTDPTCPRQCSYITRLGQDTTCDSICSVKDASTGVTTVCPAECRVDEILNNPANWMGTYDIDPPSFANRCNSTASIKAACNICKTHPECLVEVPAEPPASCADYPANNVVPEKCLECPDYCRRQNYSGVFSNFSNVDRTATNLPAVCTQVGINCSTSGSPPACNASCSVLEKPLTCRSYDPNHNTDYALCKGCPDNARYKVRYTKYVAGYTCVNGVAVPTAEPAGQYSIILSNSTASDGGTVKLAGAVEGNGWEMNLAGLGGRGSTIRFDGDTVTMVSVFIAPNVSVYADGSTVLVGWCNATLTTGSSTSGADRDALFARKPGTLYLDGSGNAQGQGTVYLAANQLMYNFTWYKNGIVYSSDEWGPVTPGFETFAPVNIQPASLFAGDNWTFSCKARHEHQGSTYLSSWLNSSTVTLLAPLVPVTQNASILPTAPFRTDTLQGFCNATYEADPTVLVSYEYRWYLNSTLFSSGAFPDPILQGVKTNIANISSSNLYKFQNWTFSCRANISGNYGEWLNSTKVSILANPPEPPCTVTNADINLTPGIYHCENADCPFSTCQANPIYVDLPNQDNSRPYCDDANVTECPYGCRVLGLDGYLNPGCAPLCNELLGAHPDCFVLVSPPTWPICNEYLGNGPASCHNPTCLGLSPGDCSFQGCTWNAAGGYCDKSPCPGTPQASCNGECTWTSTSLYVKIDDRTGSYSSRGECRQCPEQCRLDGYTGNCGVENNGENNDYIDCSMTFCPATCRAFEPLDTSAPPNPSCMPYPEGGESCKNCPALCRRSSNIMSYIGNCPSDCMLSNDTSTGCMDECRFPDPPTKACEGCFDCNMDCTYYPAIRTDCGEVCSDAALAGPVDISPNDFIKKLSGAQTSTDGEWARSIGILYIPAVVLPLFCIVIVVAFVRIFSPILGGDIEIPGLGRII
jgi:hypothetical protein